MAGEAFFLDRENRSRIWCQSRQRTKKIQKLNMKSPYFNQSLYKSIELQVHSVHINQFRTAKFHYHWLNRVPRYRLQTSHDINNSRNKKSHKNPEHKPMVIKFNGF